jgi:hypothetical protein
MKTYKPVFLFCIGLPLFFVLFIAVAGGLLDFHSEPSMDKDRIKTKNAICASSAKSWQKVFGFPAPWTTGDPNHRFEYTPRIINANKQNVHGGYWSEEYSVWFAVKRTRPCFDLTFLGVQEIAPKFREQFPSIAQLFDHPKIDVHLLTREEQLEFDKSRRELAWDTPYPTWGS